MRKFFHDYFYSTVKMFVNQFAIAIFGTSLVFATTRVHLESEGFDTLTLIVSIFSILFYLFLIYTMTWEIGAKDRIAVDTGRKPYRPHLGFWLSLFANIPNLVTAALCTVAAVTGNGDMQFLMNLMGSLLQGMYFGAILTIKLPLGAGGAYVSLNTLWPTFFIIIVPALLTCWLAYYLGHKNFRISSLFVAEKKKTEEAPKIKR